MADRWNTRKIITDTPKPPLKIYVPGDSTERWAELERVAQEHEARTPEEWAERRRIQEAARTAKPRLPSTVTEHPAGFRVRTRGDTGGTVKHEYRCPVHGVFEAMVPRSAVPDTVVCEVRCPHFHADGYLVVEGYPSTNANVCGRTSPWAGSSCGIGISSGMVKS